MFVTLETSHNPMYALNVRLRGKHPIWHLSILLWIEKLWVHLDHTSHRWLFFNELPPCPIDSLIFCSKVLTSKKERAYNSKARHLDLAIAAAMPGDDCPLQ
jgi:hypothetical protein